MSYESYKHLLGRPYISGKDDCYGLAINYYFDVYGVKIVNAARPEGWWNHPEINLLDDFMEVDKWERLGTNTRALKPGDGLVFSLITGKANHVGVYVGNGMFIHHVWNRYSCEEALLDKWTARLLMIIRHEEVAQIGMDMTPKTQMIDLLPERLRAKYI